MRGCQKGTDLAGVLALDARGVTCRIGVLDAFRFGLKRADTEMQREISMLWVFRIKAFRFLPETGENRNAARDFNGVGVSG